MPGGTWIKINGEPPHSCNLPSTINSHSGPSAIHLQKRHMGSIWKCKCGIKYKWDSDEWSQI